MKSFKFKTFRKSSIASSPPLILSLALFSFIFIWMSFFAVIHVDPHHDGILLKPALDVAQGKILFKDSFHQYGALTAFLQAALLKIFGPSLIYLRLSVAAAYGLIGVLLYSIWKRFLSANGALVAVLLWFPTAYFLGKGVTVPFLPWSSAYALLTQCVAILFLFWWKEKGLMRHLVWVGVFAALTFWFRQPVGILLAGAVLGVIGVMWFLDRPFKPIKLIKEVGLYLSGVVMASLPFLAYFVFNHAVTEWWQQSIILSSDFGNRLSNNYSIWVIVRTIFPPFLSTKHNLIWFALPASVLLTGLWLLYRYWQKRQLTQKEQFVLILAIVCLASWGQYFPVSDSSHWFWGATPMIGIMMFITYLINTQIAQFLLQRLKTQVFTVQRATLLMTTVVLGIIYLPTLRTDFKGIQTLFSRPYALAQRIPILEGMYLEPAEQQLYDSLLTKMNAYFTVYPNKSYINTSPDALYSALDSHFVQLNPMPMYWDWAAQTIYPDLLQQIHAYVASNRPLIISRDVTDFSNYCSVNLALKSQIQIEIYSRALLVMVPAEDLIKVVRKSSTTYQVTTQIDEVDMTKVTLLHPSQASQSAKLAKNIPAQVSETITVPWHATNTPASLEFTTPLYGQCVYRLPTVNNLN
jgi:hypothetical protein